MVTLLTRRVMTNDGARNKRQRNHDMFLVRLMYGTHQAGDHLPLLSGRSSHYLSPAPPRRSLSKRAGSLALMTPGILICLIMMSILPSGLLLAQQQKGTNKGAELFEKQCYSCHNIGGGDKTGPDLRGVTSRRTRGGCIISSSLPPR